MKNPSLAAWHAHWLYMFPRNSCGGAVHHFSCRSHYLFLYFFHCFISCPPPTLSACDAFFICLLNCHSFNSLVLSCHVIVLLALISYTRVNCTLFAPFWLWVLPILSLPLWILLSYALFRREKFSSFICHLATS